MKKLKIGGVTIHRLTDKIDVGEIYLQKSFEILEEDDANKVLEKIVNVSVALLEEFYSNMVTEKIITKNKS